MTNRQKSATASRVLIVAACAALLAGGGALAQGYTGPSSATMGQKASSAAPNATLTVKELLANGKDDQNAVLQGRIVSHDGGDHYTFDDGTDRIRVEIDAEDFPANQKIDDKTKVELRGELDRDVTKTEFDVDQVRVL
ncbi:NirD/YgiW/YdeI family stress tolerance protein [Pusillimonas noertemannii]|uniref:NirD/YgiW/YdeI family stress tolerance protein n=1 Tax=Pusillimonas noertemannii TaxID=305977 RepID=UPI000301E416|nr:NirD/YgiW/YdeI family stress tolerance protein [Pusillimonas noertemannii]